MRGAHNNGRILLLMAACVLVGAAGTGAVLMRLGRFPNLAFGPPTATPTATLLPTLTPSPTPPPSPTPTATPIPLARIADADQAMFAGDWPGALAAYQAVLDQSSDPACHPRARDERPGREFGHAQLTARTRELGEHIEVSERKTRLRFEIPVELAHERGVRL